MNRLREKHLPTQHRVAVVTGGTRGIGREIARGLADRGLITVLSYAGDQLNAEATAAEITASGGTALAVRADVADEQAVFDLFETVERDFGGVDVVVNSAGISSLKPLVDLDLDEFDAVVRTNLRGTFVVDQQAVRRVRAGGSIINISSSATRFQNPGNIAYVATKGAVEAMTLALARELRGRDITVNAVAPGPIATDMLERFFTGEGGEAARVEIAGRSPLQRVGTPQDVAEVVVYLATGARWINGQVIFANGGAI